MKPKQKKNTLINKSMTFAEIMQKSPEAAWILMEKGMHCMGCSMAGGETLEQGAIMHGIDADKLVEEINGVISGAKQTKPKKVNKVKKKK